MYVRRIIFFICLGALSCRVALAENDYLQFGSWDAVLEALVDFSQTEIDLNGDPDNDVKL